MARPAAAANFLSYTIANTLGHGFIEKIYENTLNHELSKNGLRVKQQYPIQVMYDGVVVGDYVADLLVTALIRRARQKSGSPESILDIDPETRFEIQFWDFCRRHLISVNLCLKLSRVRAA